MIAAVEKSFGAWAKGDVATPAFAAPPVTTGRVCTSSAAEQHPVVHRHGQPRDQARRSALDELSLGNSIFGGAFNSRIIRNIREEKGTRIRRGLR